jgi:hypothetical protein
VVDCWVIHHPPLDFHGAGGKGRRPWLCKHAPSSRMGADGAQAEERAIVADAHRIAWVPFDEFLFFVFLAEALKKITVCPVVKKRSRQISNCGFLFEQSYLADEGSPLLYTRVGLNIPQSLFLAIFAVVSDRRTGAH